MSATNYDVVAYTPELDSQIADLHRYVGNAGKARSAAYLRWKYFDNPFFDTPVLYLAMGEGRVVGMRGMLGTLWQVNAPHTTYRLPYADDFVIAPEHRNRGLAKQIMETAFVDLSRRGFGLVLSLSASPVIYVASLGLGWRSAGSYQPLSIGRTATKPLAPSVRAALSLPGVRRSVGVALLQRARGVFRQLDRAGQAATGPIRVSATARASAMAELVDKLPWDGRIRHLRDARYFAWRFRNPLHEYRFLFAGEDRLEGYLVLRRALSNPNELTQVAIVDCEAVNHEVRAALLSSAVRWGRFTRMQAWGVTFDADARAMLRALGFAEHTPSSHEGLLVREIPLATTPASWSLGDRTLLDIANWDLRMLYSMAG